MRKLINVQKLLVKENDSIIDAIKVIDQGLCQIALVVDSEKRLVGTLTDGDIRRSILNGIDLSNSLNLVMNKNFKYCLINTDQRIIIKNLKKYNIQQMPLLDREGKVVDIFLTKDINSSFTLDNPVVIMAGGKGKRLKPYTELCPKPMLKIGNKPILEILLDQYSNNGFKNFFFSVNYLKEQIIDYFGNGEKWNVSIKYLEETSELGTAGSLKLLPSNIEKPILVTNGDVLTKYNPKRLIEYHEKNKCSATICIRDYQITIPFGVIKSKDHKLLDIVEKPSLNFNLNAGIYVINKEIIYFLKKNKFIDMPDLLKEAKSNNLEVNLYPIHEYWLDIGRKETLQQANNEWLE